MEEFGGYIEGHDTDFHISTISAILEELSIEKALVQEPLKFMANGLPDMVQDFFILLCHIC